MPGHPTGTITFLFTDIDGSTQWWEKQPEWMRHAFARQEAIIRAAVAPHGGYVYKMVGDAFQVAFATAPLGLAAALDAQRALYAEDWGGVGSLRVRMALHTGVTEERGDDYVGPALNRMARLLGVTGGGQILLTQATYELVRDQLPRLGGVSLHDLGEHRLKDLSRAEHIYQLVVPDLPVGLASLQSLNVVSHNLPTQLTSFIGREKETAEVKRLLLTHRFVTLTGPGGTGKTRLALHVGARLLELFPDGVWLVELASLTDPALVPQTVAGTLGVHESSGRPLLSLVTGYLRSKDVMLILDNCEHLVGACAQLVETLLQACPSLFVLTSSRETLGVAGEVSFRVPSLSTPDVLHLASVEALTRTEAVRLFIERAEAALPGFTVTQENASAIAQICSRLDGIPLAIELAAGRVKMLRVEQVAARLDDRFRLLTGGSRSALPRHQTLRALIDWSYELLSGTERTVLQRLSVFAGGWTLEAAETICAGGDLGPNEILEPLTQLVNKSLVTPGCEPGAVARYHLLETLRQYAREKLLEAGGGDRVRERHLDYFLTLAEQAGPELRGPDQVTWLDRLDAELDNLRAAMEWSLPVKVEAGLRLAGALLWFWHIRAHRGEGVEWLERALSAEMPARDQAPVTTERQLARGLALNAAGSLRIMHGSPQRGRELSAESLALHQAIGSAGRQGAAHSLWNLAMVAAQREDFEQSRIQSEASLALFRAVQDRFWIGQCLDNLGSLALVRSDFEQASVIWNEDLVLRKEIGDKDGIAWTLSCLGNLAFRQGEYEQAKALFVASQAAFREVRNKWAVSLALSGMGAVVLAQGNFEQAAKLYEEALAFGQEMGDQYAIAGRHYDLARVAWSQGDYAQAAQLYEETLASVREIGNQEATASTLNDLGGVAWAQGNYELAVKRFEEALAIGRDLGGQFTMAYARLGLGRVACSRGEHSAAQSLYRQALSLLQASGIRWSLPHALEAWALLAVAQQDMLRGAKVLGALENDYDQLRFLLSPLERDEHERAVAAARAALGQAAFASARAEGRAMSIEQAMALALEQLEG